jgi:hypothetical protein
MGSVVVIQSSGLGAGGGSDFTPDAVNWAAITNVGGVKKGVGYNPAQTITGIDNVIQLKAVWTSTSGTPATGVWVKNGSAVGVSAASPAYVNASVNDALYFWMTTFNNGIGNYDTGTVTVTNESDGGALLDSFSFAVQYVPANPPPDLGGGGDDLLPF